MNDINRAMCENIEGVCENTVSLSLPSFAEKLIPALY
jgi:hypothetical protein